jgi:AraC family transcriptional regulator of adaptative response/methylated-DNA-[protein]-cysteine methyltransferase
MESPLGRITLGSTNKGLCLLEFDDEKRINNHFSQFKKYWDVEIIEEETSITSTTKNQLAAYFLNQQTTFDVPLDLAGTAFQLKVWNELLKNTFWFYSQLQRTSYCRR